MLGVTCRPSPAPRSHAARAAHRASRTACCDACATTCVVHGSSPVEPVEADAATVDAALDLYDVDSIGLDRLDRAVLDALVRRFRGGPVGLSTLAVAVGEEPETIESVVEPYLVRIGFMGRTPRGRIATPEAYAHLGAPAVESVLGFDDL